MVAPTTAEIQARHLEARSRSPANPLGVRATLYRIHAPTSRNISAISSGCICMTNKDVIDLVNRLKPGPIVRPPAGSDCMNGACRGFPKLIIAGERPSSTPLHSGDTSPKKRYPALYVIAPPYLIRKSAPSHAWFCTMALGEATGS